MEYKKITNLLGNNIPDNKVPRFITKKWIEVYDQSGGTYNTNKQIRFQTSMLRSDLCVFSDVYIVGKGKIAVKGANNIVKYNRSLALKNNGLFISCISKISGALIENAEDLDLTMPLYNLIQYSKNYQKTTGSLWNYYRDVLTNSITDSEPFKYKTSIIGGTPNNGNTKDVEFHVPFKYLGNFWKSLNISLVNTVVSLALTRSKGCVLTDMATKEADATADPPIEAINAHTSTVFEISDCKLYVPVVTLSAEDDNKLLELLETGFKRTIKWNKYRSEMSNQTKNNNLNYLTDPTFTNVNRLFVLSVKDNDDRDSFSKYYVPKVEVKDFNVLIDQKPFVKLL